MMTTTTTITVMKNKNFYLIFFLNFIFLWFFRSKYIYSCSGNSSFNQQVVPCPKDLLGKFLCTKTRKSLFLLKTIKEIDATQEVHKNIILILILHQKNLLPLTTKANEPLTLKSLLIWLFNNQIYFLFSSNLSIVFIMMKIKINQNAI